MSALVMFGRVSVMTGSVCNKVFRCLIYIRCAVALFSPSSVPSTKKPTDTQRDCGTGIRLVAMARRNQRLRRHFELRLAMPIKTPTPSATISANSGRRPVSSEIRFNATLPNSVASFANAADWSPTEL